jgi:hypothetical protein
MLFKLFPGVRVFMPNQWDLHVLFAHYEILIIVVCSFALQPSIFQPFLNYLGEFAAKCSSLGDFRSVFASELLILFLRRRFLETTNAINSCGRIIHFYASSHLGIGVRVLCLLNARPDEIFLCFLRIIIVSSGERHTWDGGFTW